MNSIYSANYNNKYTIITHNKQNIKGAVYFTAPFTKWLKCLFIDGQFLLVYQYTISIYMYQVQACCYSR